MTMRNKPIGMLRGEDVIEVLFVRKKNMQNAMANTNMSGSVGI
jgi:hypothetical protein